MESLAWGIGILLAIFGPLLLIPVTWFLYRFGTRPAALSWLVPRVSPISARCTALMVSMLLVGGSLSFSYFPGKWEFDRLCAEHAVPTVSERVMADSFYRSRLYPYEARQFLEGDSFEFVEAPHMYKDESYVRYSRANSEEIQEEEVETPISRYGVREDFWELPHGILMTQKTVYEMDGDRELAKAANISYQGGSLSLFLGAYAMSSCPDIRSTEGSRNFNTFYYLESIVLRATEEESVGSSP